MGASTWSGEGTRIIQGSWSGRGERDPVRFTEGESQVSSLESCYGRPDSNSGRRKIAPRRLAFPIVALRRNSAEICFFLFVEKGIVRSRQSGNLAWQKCSARRWYDW